MRALIAMSAAALVLGTAAAQDQPMKDDKPMKSAQAQFESLDRNRDQQLSKTEVKANSSIAAEFTTVDANTDGYISKPEYVAYVERVSTRPPQPR